MQQQQEELKVKHRRATVVLGSVVGVIVLAVGVYALTLGRPALVGEGHYDLGFIFIPAGEEGGWAEHTFTLTNRTRSAITIQEVRTTCGCTATRYTPSIVQPGENLDVAVRLTLSNNGLSEEGALIHTAERGVRALTIRGVGRRLQQLRTNRPGLHLRDDREQTFIVFGDIWPGDLPDHATEPSLTVDGGDALAVRIEQWAEHRPADARAQTPAIWSGQIIVAPEPGVREAGVTDATVTITMLSDHTLEFPVELAPVQATEEDRPQRPAAPDPGQFNPLDFAPGSEAESTPAGR